MTSTTKLIDANIFLKQLIDPKVKDKGFEPFKLVREAMGNVSALDVSQNDFFLAINSKLDININNKIHIATMKRHNISTIISFDKDFDKDKTITREEV